MIIALVVMLSKKMVSAGFLAMSGNPMSRLTHAYVYVIINVNGGVA